MESPKKVALETAQALAKRPEILVAATAHEIAPVRAEQAIQELAAILETAIRRSMCRQFPRGD